MEVLKEYLETSTIHGVNYISTAQSNLTKVLWFFIVIIGFSCSLYLIQDSFKDWSGSPIDTAISTHPISELDFPNVTICPRRGSNTALNYDNMMAQNINLTVKNRQALKAESQSIFIGDPAKDYTQKVIAVINPENLDLDKIMAKNSISKIKLITMY